MAVSLASLGYGVWSLVWGGLVQTLMASIAQLAAVRHPIRPLLERSASSTSCSASALGAALSGCVNYVALNGDYFLVGRLMGTANLGYIPAPMG